MAGHGASSRLYFQLWLPLQFSEFSVPYSPLGHAVESRDLHQVLREHKAELQRGPAEAVPWHHRGNRKSAREEGRRREIVTSREEREGG